MAGWMYFFNWACTSIVDVTAVALYLHYWGAFKAVPQWTIALIALVTFLVVGIVFLAGRFTVAGQSTGFSVIADNGGILPTGVLQLVIITSGVIFAYAAVELVRCGR